MDNELKAATALCTASLTRKADLSTLLRFRLSTAFRLLRRPEDELNLEDLDEAHLRRLTGKTAVEILLAVKRHAVPQTAGGPPLLGVRDAKILITLSSLAMRWAIVPLFGREMLPAPMIQDDLSSQSHAKITESLGEDRADSRRLVEQVYEIVQSSPEQPTDDQFLRLIMPHTLPYLLAVLFESAFEVEEDWAAVLFKQVTNSFSPFVIFSNLLLLKPKAGQSALPSALSRQLARPGGIFALVKLSVADNDAPPDYSHLEHIAALLYSPPAGLDSKVWRDRTILPLITLCKPYSSSASSASPTPLAFTRVAAYLLSRLYVRSSKHTRSAIEQAFHSSFAISTQLAPGTSTATDLDTTLVSEQSLDQGLTLLHRFLANTPPMTSLYDDLIGPILPILLSAYFFSAPSEGRLQASSTMFVKDQQSDQRLASLLRSWISRAENVGSSIYSSLSALQDGSIFPSNSFWSRAENGQVLLKQASTTLSSQSAATDLDIPSLIALLGESLEQSSKATLFVRWLGELEFEQSTSGESEVHQNRKVLTLQFVAHAFEIWGSSILSNPDQILPFIAFAIRDNQQETSRPNKSHPLEFVEDQEVEEKGEELELDLSAGEEIKVTALTLLLATLEGDSTLSIESRPIIKIIAQRLKELMSPDISEGIAELARQADSILSLRSAAVNAKTKKGSNDRFEKSHQTYQEALKCLEDQIIPVRAQGVGLLRSLLTDATSTDPKLYPGMLDVLLQIVAEDDSFVYLSATRGLSDLGSIDPAQNGKAIASKLAVLYGQRTPKQSAQKDLDRRLRLGEALLQLIQAKTTAAAIYMDSVVPALLAVLSDNEQPTILRTSAFSILASCYEQVPLAVIAHSESLLSAALTVLSLESRPIKHSASNEAPPLQEEVEEQDQQELADLMASFNVTKPKRRPEETASPVSTDTQHPALRRAALLFIALLARAELNARHQSASNRHQGIFPRDQTDRALTVVGYVEQVDVDELVKHQAREAIEELQELQAESAG